MTAPTPCRTAAFFRLEGTLLPRDAVSRTAVYLSQRTHLGPERLLRLGAALGARPLGSADATTADRLAWLSCRGLSEDRLSVTGPLERSSPSTTPASA